MAGRRTNNSLSSLNEICLPSLDSAVLIKTPAKNSPRLNVSIDKAKKVVSSSSNNLDDNNITCQLISTAPVIEYSVPKSITAKKKKCKEKKKKV